MGTCVEWKQSKSMFVTRELFCSEVSIPGSVDGRHGGCVGSAQRFQFQGVLMVDMMVVLVLHRGFNSRECWWRTWWLCWFCTEVSIPGSVDGGHGGCVGSAQRFQFQGVLMADMVVVLVLHRGFNSRECWWQTWWLCWFCTEVSIPGSVDGRHGGCVGSAQRFQFQGVLMADMVVVLVLHRGFNSRECWWQTWWLCWFCTEVSIPGSVDGRHGGCVGSAQRFQFQGVLMADMVVVLVLHRGFNSRQCWWQTWWLWWFCTEVSIPGSVDGGHGGPVMVGWFWGKVSIRGSVDGRYGGRVMTGVDGGHGGRVVMGVVDRRRDLRTWDSKVQELVQCWINVRNVGSCADVIDIIVTLVLVLYRKSFFAVIG